MILRSWRTQKPKVDCQPLALSLVILRSDIQTGMNRGIYAAATGMVANEKWLDVLSNNLANSNTSGFKAEGIAFGDSFENQLQSNLGERALGTLGTGAVEQNRFVDWSQGSVTETGNPLDMSLSQPGTMFGIQTPHGIQYTRAGSFTINEQRQLMTKDGQLVMDKDGKPIDLPEGELKVAPDGTLLINDQVIAQIGVFKGDFRRVSGTFFSATNAEAVESSQVRSGTIESSNVNVIEAMVGMIRIGRSYEMSQKTIQQQDELTSKLIQAMTGQ